MHITFGKIYEKYKEAAKKQQNQIKTAKTEKANSLFLSESYYWYIYSFYCYYINTLFCY